jgi:hypothetical protein
MGQLLIEGLLDKVKPIKCREKIFSAKAMKNRLSDW